jgi:hypothetical protein
MVWNFLKISENDSKGISMINLSIITQKFSAEYWLYSQFSSYYLSLSTGNVLNDKIW